MRILGVDYGTKKIGLAFGDASMGIAVPLEVIPNRGDALVIKSLASRVQNEDIELVVVGVPLSAGNRHGSEQLEKTRAFIALLEAAVKVPVVEEDEANTTGEAIRLQREEGAQADEDALAAMLVVQQYLNRIPKP